MTSSRSVHRFAVAEARRVRHPVLPGVEKHYFTVRAKDIPAQIRTDANAREAVGINRQVYRDVKDSLLGLNSTPGTFDLMNKGITILATEVRRVDDHHFDVVVDEGAGIVDGGHTYRIIVESRENTSIPDEQFVEVQIRTGVTDDLITDIARGLNTGIQVKQHSLANLDGAYDWLKEEISGEAYANVISWREGDDGEYDVRDVICILESLNIFDFPNDKPIHPIQAYEKWSIPAQKFAQDYEANKKRLRDSKYHRLRPLLKGALVLFDRIRRDFRDVHNQNGGSAGQLRIVEQAKAGKSFSFPFAQLSPSEYRLTKGALYPLFAAFRNCVVVNPKTGDAEWSPSIDGVLDLWVEASSELVAETHNAVKDIGRLPDQIGKSRGHWANLHKTLELRVLRSQMAGVRKQREQRSRR